MRLSRPRLPTEKLFDKWLPDWCVALGECDAPRLPGNPKRRIARKRATHQTLRYGIMHMTELVLVQAQKADIPAIQDVAAESWRATYGHIFQPDFIDQFLARAYSAEALRHSITSERTLFLVAKEDEQVVGFSEVGESQPNAEFVLFRIYLLPACWGRGIGGRLLERAEKWLRERGATGYCCHVHSQNEVGKAFYQKAGFVHLPERDREDEWYMWKPLEAP